MYALPELKMKRTRDWGGEHCGDGRVIEKIESERQKAK
jgi:hypothetical protein